MNRKELLKRVLHQLIPNAGTIVLVLALFWAREAGALGMLSSTSTTTISYQGRLADSGGNPITNAGLGMSFRIYNTTTGGSALWTETYSGVPVNNGLFHVLLGSTNPLPASLFTSNDTLYLGITVGADSEMTPREQLASAPYAMQANSALTVPDGSIATAKIANGAITSSKIADGAVTSSKIVDGSITTEKVADGAISPRKISLASGSLSATSGFALTTSWQDIPGTTGNLLAETNLTVIAIAVFDFSIFGGSDTTTVGVLAVDGVAQSGQAIMYGGDSRGTVSQTYRFQVTPGTHVIKLQATKTTNGGASVQGTHTRLTWFMMNN